jgi:hypothetical protein
MTRSDEYVTPTPSASQELPPSSPAPANGSRPGSLPPPEPIRLFFPPKWGINDKLPSQPVLTGGQLANQEQAALF